MRIGFGFDVHPLKEGYSLWLGGVNIPHNKGCVGHSDADVLLHAICDAMLGAAGLRDIGYYFPNTDDAYKGISSKILLQKVVELVKNEGYQLGNLDSTLCMEKPKINPYIPDMKKVLAEILHVQESQISIKATTNEKLGYIGSEDGAHAYAVVLLIKN